MNESFLVVPQQVTDRNRARIVLTLGQSGPLSRSDLARLSGVTRTTIGTYVDGLIGSGVLEDLTTANDGSTGRPARPVWFRRGAVRCGSVVIDKDHVEAGIIDVAGEVVERAQRALPADADAELTSKLALDALQEVGGLGGALLGVGVALAGTIDFARQQIVRAARFPALDGSDLIARLQDAIPSRTVIDNDARAGALAELWWGHGRSALSFWTVQVGEGIGAASVIDGEVKRGRNGAAGEIGHTTVSMAGHLCACGQRGCWETVASIGALRRAARRRGLSGARGLTPVTLYQRIAAGDVAAQTLADGWVDEVAVGLTNLFQSAAPDLVILQGDIVGGGERLRGRLHETVATRSLALREGEFDIRLSDLGPSARLLGGGALVLATTWALET